MEFTQNNQNGDNKVLVQAQGSFIDQSNQIREYVNKKERNVLISNLIGVAGLIIGILSLILR